LSFLRKPCPFRTSLHIGGSVLPTRKSRGHELLYSIILHSLAGVLAGSIFKVQTLVLLLLLILLETGTVAAMGVHIGAIWIFASLVAIQLGYFAGLMMRHAAEQAGYSVSSWIRNPQ